MKLLMVFNPHAASGRAARLLPRLTDALRAFASVDVLQTRWPGDAVEQVAAADLVSYSGLLAAGGDGTLFEVLNGLYRHQRQRRVPLGVVPVGTGNAFARDLGLMPGDWKKAVGIVQGGCLRNVDVGCVEPIGQGREAPFHFLNIVGTGLPCDALRTAVRLKFLGNAAYSLGALWHAMLLKSYPLHIEIQEKTIEQEALFVEISNTRYTGTTFLMAPSAKLDDGLLDVTLVRRMPRRRLFRLFPTIYSGRHVEYEEVSTLRASRLRLLAPAGLPLVPDGEFCGRLPAEIRCLRRDLKVFA